MTNLKNMQRAVCLVCIMLFCAVYAPAIAQKIRKVKNRIKGTAYIQVYHVKIAEDDEERIYHGPFKLFYNHKAEIKGQYTDGQRSGVWSFYTRKGELSQQIDYENAKVLFDAMTIRPFHTLEKEYEQSPVPVGGLMYLSSLIANQAELPTEARREGAHGQVLVTVTVSENGTADGFSVLKGIHQACDEQALEIVAATATEWLPAVDDDHFVESKVVIPVNFFK